MKPALKRAKLLRETVLIHLCDAFTRTDGNIICPLIKAESSVRVLYKLEKDVLYKAVQEAGAGIGLTDPTFLWKSEAAEREMEGNLFVEYSSDQSFDDNNLKQYRETLAQKLTKVSKVKHILVAKVQNTKDIIPQPIISETSFDLHKLELCSEFLDLEDPDTDIFVASETIKSYLDDLKGQYTKFAVLSQNGRGKSFILNLLMLLTADNEKEYGENNQNLKLPKDIDENAKLEEIKENVNLPDVVKDFLNTASQTQKKSLARSVIDPLCCELPEVKEVPHSNNLLSNVANYFSTNSRINIDPYILAQKKIKGSYESTTKCIIHLRYGTVYQMSVNYFTEEELQQQLFELVTLNGEDSSSLMGETNEKIRKRAQECLKARFEILTDYGSFTNSQEMKDRFQSPQHIVLSKEVRKFAGKTELYIGNGKEAQRDRLAMQSILRQITTTNQRKGDDKVEDSKKKIAAVKQIVIYLPSKILYGGKEILEMPGMDDSDPMAMNFIETALNEVDAVIVISEFALTIAETEVKDMLFNSGFGKYWKKNPSNYKLMLLAYPEKDQEWQFGKDKAEDIENLEQEEDAKRRKELDLISNILQMNPLPEDFENSIITAYILPVLHISILAHQGEEYKIFQDNEQFLKNTGIKNLITVIDGFVASKQRITIEKVKAELSHFHQEVPSRNVTDAAKSVLHVLNIKENRSLLESTINNNNEKIFVSFDKSLKQMISEVIDTKVDAILKQTAEEAKINWTQNKDKIKSFAVYNPYFYGKNPVYKVKLFNIFFDGLEDKKNYIFSEIKSRIEPLLKECKDNIMKQLVEDINKLLVNNHDPFTLEFVQQAVGNELDAALAWYLGNKKRPFNEKTMKKCFDTSQNQSLKKVILVPNFKQESPLAITKQKTEENIEKCIMDIKESFLDNLLALHKKRLKSLHGKLMTPKGSSKMWQRLVYQMKLICKLRDPHPHKDKLEASIKMLSANFDEL